MSNFIYNYLVLQIATFRTVLISCGILGTIGVTVTFPFIFMHCLNCSDKSQWIQFAYYLVFVAVFQVSWASVQISHLNIINHLTPVQSEHVELTGLRQVTACMRLREC